MDGLLLLRDTLHHQTWAARLTARLPQPTTEPSLAESLLQVALHSSHHRGQLCSRLRELDAAPPAIDYILWVYAGKPAAGSRA